MKKGLALNSYVLKIETPLPIYLLFRSLLQSSSTKNEWFRRFWNQTAIIGSHAQLLPFQL